MHDDRQSLVDYHVAEKKSDQKQVAVLSDRNYLVGQHALLPKSCRDLDIGAAHILVTYGVPLTLSTLSWVTSKLMYPRVRPANTPERSTRTGTRHAKAMNFASCGGCSLLGCRWAREGRKR